MKVLTMIEICGIMYMDASEGRRLSSAMRSDIGVMKSRLPFGWINTYF